MESGMTDPPKQTRRTKSARTKRRGQRRKDWQTPFLGAFAELGMVTAACEAAGISRDTAYQERQRDEAFALAWADVEERSTETMEAEAYRRAVTGTTKPLVSAGKHVCDVQEYSDSLLQFMLRARRPDRYRENVKVEHGGQVKLERATQLSDEELASRAAELLA